MLTRDEVGNIINEMDRNRDGVIDYSMFRQATMARQQTMELENLRTVYRLFDRYGDNRFSIEEFRANFDFNGDAERAN